MKTAAAVAVAAIVAVSAMPSYGASTKSVSVKDDKFVAKSLTLSKGAAVRWVWKGKAPHNVTVVSGPSQFRAGTRKKGSFKHTFTKRGTYRIICTIHEPEMKMTVKVK
jgi:plastocyanin